MSNSYNPHRTRNLFDPASAEPFKLSRSMIDRFLECPRCFYLDRRLGVARPKTLPFTLNSAVDALLKREFDACREKAVGHALITKHGLDAAPAAHKDLELWRNNFKGVQHLHAGTNLLVTGAIDDLWKNERGELIVVEYKATAKNENITGLNEPWHDGYKRQMEVYQWLIRRNGHPVAETGYFIYCNGRKDRGAFNGRLEFDMTLIAYTGSDAWIEPTLEKIAACLGAPRAPDPAKGCDYCRYTQAVRKLDEAA